MPIPKSIRLRWWLLEFSSLLHEVNIWNHWQKPLDFCLSVSCVCQIYCIIHLPASLSVLGGSTTMNLAASFCIWQIWHWTHSRDQALNEDYKDATSRITGWMLCMCITFYLLCVFIHVFHEHDRSPLVQFTKGMNHQLRSDVLHTKLAFQDSWVGRAVTN